MTEFHLPETIDGLPNLCGSEAAIERAARDTSRRPMARPIDFSGIQSCFAIALHMHQPLIPAGGDDLRSAGIISNLQHMMEHPNEGDNHNAPKFQWCYQRMGELIPQLIDQGKRPRVMLDYSGCLLQGMRQMGLNDVFDNLRRITCDTRYRDCVEWLGTAWGHAVAPSTPVKDFRDHVMAWRHHFAAIFGTESLSRVAGFSPPEMALPNHPDVSYEFVRTLLDCGYRYVLVQEHTVERVEDAGPARTPHLPHRLVARNSLGQTASIIAIIKTRGSDTKLVGQMQPYYEAQTLARLTLGGKSVPQMVTQISDGENGGVIMNEFPSKYVQVMEEASRSDCPPVNAGEYLSHLDSLGIRENDLPAIQPIMKRIIWDHFRDGAGPEEMEKTLQALRDRERGFHVEGGSWSSHISWVRGYRNVLTPMQQASELFEEKVRAKGVSPADPRYRSALYHLMLTQTSCFRYWGEGRWTEYAKELCRRAIEVIERES
jgi:hypothetical protein